MPRGPTPDAGYAVEAANHKEPATSN